MADTALKRGAHRQVPVRVFTPKGWIAGKVFCPPKHTLIYHISECGAFLKLIEVTLPGLKNPFPFFAVQLSFVSLLIPDEPAENVLTRHVTMTAEHQIACLLREGLVRGTFRLQPNVRVSDHLRRSRELFGMHKATLNMRDDKGRAYQETPPLVLVNPAALIGISEAS